MPQIVNWFPAGTSTTGGFAIPPTWVTNVTVTMSTATTNNFYPVYDIVQNSAVAYPTETPEQAATRLERDRVAREAREARQTVLEAAKQRALVLLQSLLTEEQSEELNRHLWVDFLGSNGRRYRVICNQGYVGNVVDLETMTRYCCHPDNARDIPVFDTAVAQMLALQTDAEGFMGLANRHGGYVPVD